jgi:O-antigen ligase
LQIGGLVGSFARTAWVGFMAATVTIVVVVRGLPRKLAGLWIAILVLAALLVPAIRWRLVDFLTFHDNPRVRLWHTALRIWQEHPVVGAGLGSYKTQFYIYKVPGEYGAHGHPHNDFLNMLVHSGIVGIAAFAFIFIRYFRMIGGARRTLGLQDPRRSLLVAAVLVPVAFFVGGVGQCFLTDEEVGQLFWFVVALFVAVAREVRDEVA